MGVYREGRHCNRKQEACQLETHCTSTPLLLPPPTPLQAKHGISVPRHSYPLLPTPIYRGGGGDGAERGGRGVVRDDDDRPHGTRDRRG